MIDEEPTVFKKLIVCLGLSLFLFSIQPEVVHAQACKPQKREVRAANKALSRANNELAKATRQADSLNIRFQRAQDSADRAIGRKQVSCSNQDSRNALAIERLENQRFAMLGTQASLLIEQGIACIFGGGSVCARIQRRLAKVGVLISRNEGKQRTARDRRDLQAERCAFQVANLVSTNATKIARAENRANEAANRLPALQDTQQQAQVRADNAEAALQACLGQGM
jgi:hypothetical protein